MAVLLILAAIVACCLAVCIVLLILVTLRSRPGLDGQVDGSELARHVAPDAIHRYQLGSLPPQTFKVHHGFEPSVGDGLPPIDSVVVSPYGLFVIIVIGWSGRLAVTDDGRRWEHDNGWWTRRRPSPVPKARSAAASVASHLDLAEDVVLPIVCLSSRTLRFDGEPPEPVVRSGDLARRLRSVGPTVLDAGDIERVDRLLAEHVAAAGD